MIYNRFEVLEKLIDTKRLYDGELGELLIHLWDNPEEVLQDLEYLLKEALLEGQTKGENPVEEEMFGHL